MALIVWAILLLIIGGYGLLPAAIESFDLRKVQTAQDEVYLPIARLTAALQEERHLSVELIGRDSSSIATLWLQRRQFDQALWSQRRKTDQTIAAFRESADHSVVQGDQELSRRVRSALSQLSDLEDIRTAVDIREPVRRDVIAGYTRIVDTMFPIFQAMPANDDLLTTRSQLMLVTVQRLQEASANERALLAGAISQGQLTVNDHNDFDDQVAIRRHLTDELRSELKGTQQRAFNRLAKGESLTRLRDYETQITNQDPSKPDIPIAESDWAAVNTAALAGLANL